MDLEELVSDGWRPRLIVAFSARGSGTMPVARVGCEGCVRTPSVCIKIRSLNNARGKASVRLKNARYAHAALVRARITTRPAVAQSSIAQKRGVAALYYLCGVRTCHAAPSREKSTEKHS